MPERAIWIRMLMAELNRISSHLVWMATNGMDLGATSMMIYGFRERELILAFFEKTAAFASTSTTFAPAASRPICPTAGKTTCS